MRSELRAPTAVHERGTEENRKAIRIEQTPGTILVDASYCGEAIVDHWAPR